MSEEIPQRHGIRVVTLGSRTFYLLGTAHVSADSVTAVEETIQSGDVDHVCIEIDEGRYRSVARKKDWSQLNIFEVIKRRQAFLLLSNLVLSSFQRRMGESTGVTPGSEMIAAVNAAKRAEIGYSFGDRPVSATLRRAWAKTGLWGKNKLLASMLASAFSREKVTEEDLKKLQEQNELESMLQELADYLPSVKRVLIDERDQYLAQSIWESPSDRVLAVVGAGHVPGIIQWLSKLHEYHHDSPETPLIDKDALEVIPPPGIVRKSIPYVIPAIVAGLIIWGFFRGGVEGGLQSLTRWILVNGTLSAAGALVALAHPITVIASFAAAPITSMNPTVGVGFVSGLLEAVLRKPRVTDFENLNTDILSVRGVYRNRLTRILLVFLFSTVGSAVGTFIALPLLFP
ncbi:MAG TPA: TraB/GumN family protein [Alkalispirochaeta sp.]|nr:TraB/GumN family protein [Alkalispirochaeta sp.]